MILEESREQQAKPAGARAVGAAVGAAPSLPALGPPAQPAWHGRDIAVIKGASRPQKSPGLAGMKKYQTHLEIKQENGNRGKRRKKQGQNEPWADTLLTENIQCGESSPPERVARGATHFLITPRRCGSMRWKSKVMPTTRRRRLPLSGCRFLVTSSEAARVMKKPLCWRREGHGAPAGRSGVGIPKDSPTSSSKVNNSLRKKSPSTGRSLPWGYLWWSPNLTFQPAAIPSSALELLSASPPGWWRQAKTRETSQLAQSSHQSHADEKQT